MKLVDKYPQIEEEFDPERSLIALDQVTVGSTRPVAWICLTNKNHSWEASGNQRTSGGKLRGCPYCAGKKVIKEESFGSVYSDLAKGWSHINPISSFEVTPKSNKKVIWVCSSNLSHTWTASPKQRANGNKCPSCNSLSVRNPEIASEWHDELNGLQPIGVPSNSHTSFWWKCPKGFDHVWLASPNTRVSTKSGCPICSGHKVVESNSLAATNPEVAAQWIYEENNGDPTTVYKNSRSVFWWQCNVSEDHRWEASVRSRTSGSGCPACLGRKIVSSNNLEYTHPEIAQLWNTTKNDPLLPSMFTAKSNKNVWWKCPVGDDHEWKSTIANITSGSSCPVCMGRKITTENNFAKFHPELLKEWDYEKNILNPQLISPGTKTKAWWICSRNNEHLWYGLISDRTVKESGCPFCAIKLNVSELKMLDYIKEIFPRYEVLYRQKPKWLNRLELDVFIPKLDLAFEYQGRQHLEPIEFFGGRDTYIAQVKRDKLKAQICMDKGVTLIYVYYNEKLSRSLIEGKLKMANISM